MAQKIAGNKYHKWLEHIISLRDHIYSDYTIIRSLRRPFFVSLEQDKNRAIDGLELRREYEEIYGVPAPTGACSVLEVLIGLSRRIAFMTSRSFEENEDVVYWFWVLIDNLELSDNEERNGEILVRWMERKIHHNGKGSPFPLQNCDENQKKVELWYQMQYYVSENYHIS